ncbi:DUF1876 domain-containing protein [Rhodococcus sp. NPDC003348]
MNLHEKKWSVDIIIDEHDSTTGETRTRAEARLRTKDATSLVGIGVARRNPRDADIPEIGDELAVARALADLAHRLIDTAATDLEAVTHERVHLDA